MPIYSAQSCCDSTLFDLIEVSGGTGFDFTVSAIIQQPDGKFVAGGSFTTYNGITSNRIIRINTDGTIDISFNIGVGFDSQVLDLVLQPDGKIIAVGDFTTYDGNSRNRVVRINSDGSIDNTFSVGTGFNSSVSTIVLQSDGKVVCGGSFNNYNGNASNCAARLNSNGSFDNTYVIGTGFGGSVTSSDIQVDDKIIFVGAFTTFNGSPASYIARLNTNGSLDGTFSFGTGFDSPTTQVKIQSDGKVLIGGAFTDYNGNSVNRIVRVNSDGSIDGTFTIGTGLNSFVRSFSIQTDNKIIVGGSFTDYDGNSVNRIVRLNSNGNYDATFNIGSGFDNTVFPTVIQSDGKIVVGGSFTDYDGNSREKILRLNSDGSLDGGFNGGGVVGEFYFSNEPGYYGCWELLSIDLGPSNFSATTGPYSSCTECRQVSNNECCFEITNCDNSEVYYGILTGGTLNVGDFYYFDFVGDSTPGCYEINSLSYSANNFTINFTDGPFIDCPDCATGASTSNFYFFSSCCSNDVFLLTDIPTTLSLGDVYYVESDAFSGCAQVISDTRVSNRYSAISLTSQIDCESCISSYPCTCSSSDYCFNTTHDTLSSFNGTYSASCCYNSNTVYSNSDGTAFVFYDGTKWCLSDTLGGSCILHGNSPCVSLCPDLCEDYFFQGSCPTTTTTTSPCDVFDFDGIFDCLITSPPSPTPSPTPTLPPTSTPLPTPTPTICGVDFTYSLTTIPDPSPTPTPTPTPSPSPNLPVGGTVTFNLFDKSFECPVTKKLFDCIDNFYYYVNEPLVFGGVDILIGETFGGYINGKKTCLTYEEISTTSSNAVLDQIFAVYGIGCNTCEPFITTTVQPPVCNGAFYNLVTTPYNFANDGNIIFFETTNPSATQGILDPNTFVTNSVNFSLVDSLGNSQVSYFSGLTGNSFTISFSQGLNSVVYSGLPNTFLSIVNTIYYSPVLTSGLTLIQSSNTMFDISEKVCINYEITTPSCDCSLYYLENTLLQQVSFDYTNCNGGAGNVIIPLKGPAVYTCAKTNTITSTSGLNPILLSDCCNLNCSQYQIINFSSPITVSYVDCNKEFVSISYSPGVFVTFCAIENTVVVDGTATINNLGNCTI